nr:rad17 gene [Schizosaccharomyces pombe]
MRRQLSFHESTKRSLKKKKIRKIEKPSLVSKTSRDKNASITDIHEEDIEAFSDEENKIVHLNNLKEDRFQLWFEKYIPQKAADLAVHKSKISAIKQWMLTDSLESRLLLICGPSGCGKSTAVQVLAKELGYSLIEWLNPMNLKEPSNQESDTLSLTEKFSRFMSLCETYPELELMDSNNIQKRGKNAQGKKKFIFLDEIPHLSKFNGSLDAFRNVIRTALTSRGAPSIIMVLTEIQLNNLEGINSQDRNSFNSVQIMGNDLLQDPRVTVLQFNPIAPTYMKKCLGSILRKEGVPKSPKLLSLVENICSASEGDLRSAINGLQLSISQSFEKKGTKNIREVKEGKGKGNDFSLEAAQVLERLSKSDSEAYARFKNYKGAYIPKSDKNENSFFKKDVGLGMMHAIGKVVWNKREGDDEVLKASSQQTGNSERIKGVKVSKSQENKNCISLKSDQRERMLNVDQCFTSKRRSLVDIESTINQSGLSGSVFRYGLFENYVDSCVTTDEAFNVCDLLSISDCLSHDFPYSYTGDEISTWFSVQGTLFYLPSPVPRKWRQLRFQQWNNEGIVRGIFDDYMVIYGKRSVSDPVIEAHEDQVLEDIDDPIEDED